MRSRYLPQALGVAALFASAALAGCATYPGGYDGPGYGYAGSTYAPAYGYAPDGYYGWVGRDEGGGVWGGFGWRGEDADGW